MKGYIRQACALGAGLAIGVIGGVFGSTAVADVPQHNPFRNPDVLSGLVMATGTGDRVVAATARPELRATLVGGAAPLALVGDRLMAIGDDADGFVLRAVHEGRAVFERAGERIEVRLAPPGNGGDAEELTDE